MPATNPAPQAPRKTNHAPVKNVPDRPHAWVGAAVVELTEQKARRAAKYQSYRADEGEKIPVLDVYCSACRRPIEDVRNQPCAALEDNQHLIGGDQSVRAKRKHVNMPASAVPMPAPRINRYGIDAVINGQAEA